MSGPGGVALVLADAISAGIDLGYRPSLQTQHLGLFGSMTVMAVVFGYWIRRTRRTRGGRLFAVTVFLLAIRLASDVVHGLVGELWTLQAVLVAVNPLLELLTLVAFLRFAGRYAGLPHFDDGRVDRVLVGVVAVSAITVVTNPVHGLVFTGFEEVWAPFTHVTGQLGVLGFGLVALNGALLLACAGILAHEFTRGARPAWWSTGVLTIGVTQAALVGWVNLTVGGVIPRYDYAAIGLGGFVLVTTAALLDHGLQRIEVVARRSILDEIDDAVVVLDRDGRVAEYNPAARRLFWGIEEGDRFSERFDDPGDLPLETGTARAEMTLSATEMAPGGAGDPPVAPESEAGTEPAPQSGERHFQVHTTRVRSGTGELLGHTVRFVDVTDLRHRSRELQRTNERLDEFAATVSHDLRNPLNVAAGYRDLVADAVDADPDGFDVDAALANLETVETSLDRMDAIIDDILALVRDADPVTETEPVEFAELVTAAWNSVDTGRATVQVATNGHLQADRDRLQRLLENLFRNAIDHVGEDVTVETGLGDGAFYVADDGPGIPEAERDRIFDHGFTTGDEGTGLGLSIVAQLAEAHGWEVALDPEHDGTRFVVSGCETAAGTTNAEPHE